MTRKIYAIALALGMFAAFSTPSHAALSGADRAPVATAPTQAAVEANASPGFTADAPAATTATPTTAAQAAPVTVPHKPIIQKARVQIAPAAHFAPATRVASSYGYPCR